MCPLRLILIFLSATLAGFFVIRNVKFQQPINNDDPIDKPGSPRSSEIDTNASLTCPINGFSKALSVVVSGFWALVDMASGRYLWRHLVSSSSPSPSHESSS